MRKYLITFSFVIVLYTLAIFNLGTVTGTFKNAYAESHTLSDIKVANQGLEALVNDGLDVGLKHRIWDVYGIVCKALNIKIIGDFKFLYLDGSYLVGDGAAFNKNIDNEVLLNELEILKKETEKSGADLLYLDLPIRNIYYDEADYNEAHIQKLQEMGVDTISLSDITPYVNSINDYYYKTDAHLRTDAA